MRTRTAIGAWALFFLAGAAAGSDAPAVAGIRYTVFLAGNRAGEQVVRPVGTGGWDVHFEFNDRGRGPKVDERIDCDEAGVPTRVEIAGNDYFKGAVEEHFRRDPSSATWKSAQESGDRPSPGRAFYLPFNGTPRDSGLLARALWRAPGHRLPLLPDGAASIERVGERTLRQGGEEKVVTQYAITGIDFQAIRVWLDGQDEFFASVSGWSSVIPEGWESSVAELQRGQDEASAAHGAELARILGRHPSALVFEHASIFDSVRATIRPATTVVVAGGRIAAVGADGTVSRPPGAEVIDASGKTLLPGLWDMHVHLSPGDGLLDIVNGVTTVRDLGNDPDVLAGIKKGFDDGTAIGPRVVLAGLVDGSGPFSGPIKNKVDDEAQARSAVDDYARRGYVQIKIYSSIKRELMPVIARLAHARDAGIGACAGVHDGRAVRARGRRRDPARQLPDAQFSLRRREGHPDAGALHGRGRARRRDRPVPGPGPGVPGPSEGEGDRDRPDSRRLRDDVRREEGRDLAGGRRDRRSDAAAGAAELSLRQPPGPRGKGKALPGFLSVDAPNDQGRLRRRHSHRRGDRRARRFLPRARALSSTSRRDSCQRSLRIATLGGRA